MSKYKYKINKKQFWFFFPYEFEIFVKQKIIYNAKAEWYRIYVGDAFSVKRAEKLAKDFIAELRRSDNWEKTKVVKEVEID